MAPEVWAAIIGVGGIFFTSCLTVGVTRWSTKRTILANRESIIANKRQEWMDALRDDIAKYIACSGKYRLDTFVRKEIKPERDKEVLTNMVLCSEIGQRIVLRLNPKEDLHKKLEDQIAGLNRISQEDDDLFIETKTRIVAISRDIFKQTWQEIKQGK